MRKRKTNILSGIDWILVLLFFALTTIGWMTIYAATNDENSQGILDFSTLYGKQIIWIGFSFVLILILIAIDSKFYERFASVIYVLSMLSLLGLFVFGNEVNGAKSWYNFGGFSLQPSEFAKTATILALANFLNAANRDLTQFKTQWYTALIMIIPALLILLQPDAGSAVIYVTLVFVLYREGLPSYFLLIGLGIILLFLATLYFGFTTAIIMIFGIISLFFFLLVNFKKIQLKREWPKIIAVYVGIALMLFSVDYVFNNVIEQHQRDRFNIVLGKTIDNRGIGYNTNQSMIAIGSGGWSGKGYLEGDRTQGNFVPEQETDYIFSAIGEEWGFVGSSLVIVLFVMFILRIIQLAERQKSAFSRIFGYAVATLFFFHFMVNIGMVIGILPTVGIPLPFFSYGGSSLWGFTMLLFIFIRLDADRTYEW